MKDAIVAVAQPLRFEGGAQRGALDPLPSGREHGEDHHQSLRLRLLVARVFASTLIFCVQNRDILVQIEGLHFDLLGLLAGCAQASKIPDG